MSQITITVDDTLVTTLEQLATENHLSSEEYAAGIVDTFLDSQYRGAFVQKVTRADRSELSKLDSVVLAETVDVQPVTLEEKGVING